MSIQTDPSLQLGKFDSPTFTYINRYFTKSIRKGNLTMVITIR